MATQKVTNVPSRLQNWCQLVRTNVTPCAADIRLQRKREALMHIDEMKVAIKELEKIANAL